MRAFSLLRQLAITTIFLIGWVVVLSRVIEHFYPEDDELGIDSAATGSPLVSDAPSIIVYGIDRLRRPADRRMIVVGSSSAMLNLRADDLREDLPGWEVHNLACPTSNVQQVAQIVEMVVAVSDEQTLRNTVFVLFTHYIIYAMPEPLWRGQASPMNEELLRYGLYAERAEGEPAPILGYALAPLTKEAHRLLLGTALVAKTVKAGEDALEAGEPLPWEMLEPTYESPYKYARRPPGENHRKKENNRRVEQIGTEDTLDDGQFERLERLADDIRSVGARLVIVDGPVPSWNRGDHFQHYVEQRASFVRGLAERPGVDYVDFTDLLPDSLFGDSAHTLRSGSARIEDAVVEQLRRLPEPIE